MRKKVTARRLRQVNFDAPSHQILVKLSKPVTYGDWYDDEKPTRSTKFVVVSGTYVIGKPETYIFPADRKGEIVSWLELPGSFQGEINIPKAIELAGWEPVDF